MTTSVVIPPLLGLDVANAVAEVQYLRMVSALVDREHRPMLGGARGVTGCKVIEQHPRPGTEVVVSDLTITVTMTVRCGGRGRDSRPTPSRRQMREAARTGVNGARPRIEPNAARRRAETG